MRPHTAGAPPYAPGSPSAGPASSNRRTRRREILQRSAPPRNSEGQRMGKACSVCSFVADSRNKMAKHMFETGHNVVVCPECDAFLVGRAYRDALVNLRKPSKKKQAKCVQASGSASGSNSPNDLSSSPATSHSVSSSAFMADTSRIVDISDHPHLAMFPSLVVLEMDSLRDVPLPPVAEASQRAQNAAPLSNFGHPDASERSRHATRGEAGTPMAGHESNVFGHATGFDLTEDETGASHSGADSPSVEDAADKRDLSPFRCADCLNNFGSWTQMTRHVLATTHTLPRCAQCNIPLKCFGQERPYKHEDLSSHSGSHGFFYVKDDYSSRIQEPHNVYTRRWNKFTGLDQLQYQCVCGLVFLHPVLLAAHLIAVHKVRIIGQGEEPFFCVTCCKLFNTIEEAKEHVKTPFQSLELPKHRSCNRRHRSTDVDDVQFDYRRQLYYNHEFVIANFEAAQFLAYRPLSYVCYSEVRRETACKAGVTNTTETAPGEDAQEKLEREMIVLYQCKECLYLFSSWDLMVSHLTETGHCASYCATCGLSVPPLMKPAYRRRGAVDPITDLQAELTRLRQADPTLLTYEEHVRLQHNVIGMAPSPESMEVLADIALSYERDRVDPSPEVAMRAQATASHATNRSKSNPYAQLSTNSDRVFDHQVLCYQCPAHQQKCYKVFLFYGDLVNHFLETTHGQRAQPGDSTVHRQRRDELTPGPRSSLLVCIPMVAYRKKFTTRQLLNHFGFVLCENCNRPFPPDRLALHIALCAERWRKLSPAERDAAMQEPNAL